MIDFDWYRSFVAVYRAGSVSRAAETRLLTQPAITQHLKGLEAAVGEPLFMRLPRQMAPTARGKDLYSRVAQAVDTLEQTARHLVGLAADEQPLVRLGAPADYFATAALPRLVGAPFRLWVRFGETAALLTALGRGEVDLVVATQRLPSPGIEYATLTDERFLLVGPQRAVESAIASEDDLPLGAVERWLAGQRWISYGPELPIIRRFWQQTFGHRPALQPAFVIPDLRAILEAVALGYGISLLPDYLCRAALAAGRLRVVWEPPQAVGNELWLAYRRVDRQQPAVQLPRAMLSAPLDVAVPHPSGVLGPGYRS